MWEAVLQQRKDRIHSTSKCPFCTDSGIRCIKCDIATDEGSVYILYIWFCLIDPFHTVNKTPQTLKDLKTSD